MVTAMIGYRHTAFRYDDFEIMFALLGVVIDIDHEREVVDRFVGDVLQEAAVIFYPDNFTLIIYPDKNSTALGIGKAAYPFQVFVPPACLYSMCCVSVTVLALEMCKGKEFRKKIAGNW